MLPVTTSLKRASFVDDQTKFNPTEIKDRLNEILQAMENCGNNSALAKWEAEIRIRRLYQDIDESEAQTTL